MSNSFVVLLTLENTCLISLHLHILYIALGKYRYDRESHHALRRYVRSFLETEIFPYVQEWEEEGASQLILNLIRSSAHLFCHIKPPGYVPDNVSSLADYSP